MIADDSLGQTRSSSRAETLYSSVPSNLLAFWKANLVFFLIFPYQLLWRSGSSHRRCSVRKVGVLRISESLAQAFFCEFAKFELLFYRAPLGDLFASEDHNVDFPLDSLDHVWNTFQAFQVILSSIVQSIFFAGRIKSDIKAYFRHCGHGCVFCD